MYLKTKTVDTCSCSYCCQLWHIIYQTIQQRDTQTINGKEGRDKKKKVGINTIVVGRETAEHLLVVEGGTL